MKYLVIFLLKIAFVWSLGNLIPGAQVNNRIKYNEEIIYQIHAKDLLPNQYYKIMVHYLGSVYTFS
jgi:hypothetical protein